MSPPIAVELAAHVQALLHQRLPAEERALAVRFAERWLAGIDLEDFGHVTAEDLYCAVLSHWRLALARHGADARVHVFNPRLEEHGWQSPHTVVQMANDDMPFLVDTVVMAINNAGLALHRIVHPVMHLGRDAAGEVTVIEAPGAEPAAGDTSLIHLEVDRRTDADLLARLQAGLETGLADVRAAVQDWRPMQARLAGTVATLAHGLPAAVPAAQTAEDCAFLQWLDQGNFTFLGCRDYELHDSGDDLALHVVPGSGLGILRESGVDARSAAFAALPAEVRASAGAPVPLLLTKANARATVHRPAYLDYVGVKRFDDTGRVIGERRFLGLYTAAAYSAPVATIPVLRGKVAEVIRRAGFRPGSHAAKVLATVLEQYPRDELFQIGSDELLHIALGIVHLSERPRTRLFLRRDPYGRSVSCLIFVPRERYDTALRERMQAVLTDTCGGSVADFSVLVGHTPLARLLIVVRTRPGEARAIDVDALEQRLVEVARRWEDDLRDALQERLGEAHGGPLAERYATAFPVAWKADFTARLTVPDIEVMESLASPASLGMRLYVPLEAQAGHLRLKIFRLGEAVPLSVSLPMLENMGVSVFEERPYRVARADGSVVTVHDFTLQAALARDAVEDARERFQQALQQVWAGRLENDDLNRLVLLAGLEWRDVVILRACTRYLKQTPFPFSPGYTRQTLVRHAEIARLLVEFFRTRFDPDGEDGREAREAALGRAIETRLDAVASLDEDRILRQVLTLMRAMLRTNAFRLGTHGQPPAYFSFKLDARRLDILPQPRPRFEIFVHSPRVEGIHLRGGKVARGGLRWSDRPEDFRTEVLGLMKAQMVKNAVIVPVGSKGGFIVRNPPPERDALLQEGVACYRDFLRGLLDLTDNRAGGTVLPPPGVVRREDEADRDDPYLVVAADKGTAAFSDIANAVAAEYGFWLGDAFASGGSSGYDHKKMAITARGTWESVRQHFAELGVDVQLQPITVAGIGDMSGDVFGNGMLRSPHIRLVAAFDHRHIFLDPDPDAARSFTERQRLFAQPRSSWADYDPTLISAGGGVWPRAAKSIPLSPAVQASLHTEATALTPAELIQAILRAPVDLLYNGGIGTYVKASAETHAEADDKANDTVRVDARALRCKVVAEGGNLGLTQRARVEYALAGGRINTDAIDNSGGVDCSDHEVNIKILLDSVAAEGELTRKQRDRLLAEMTDEVAGLVLRDNVLQNHILTMTGARGIEPLDEQARYLRHLEAAGRLNRTLERLPDERTLTERRAARIGLTRPELAVLLAYAKLELYDALLGSAVPDDELIGGVLLRYFPRPLREHFPAHIARHPLRREIVSTFVANAVVNRVGPTFVHALADETGAALPEIIRAYVVSTEVFDLHAYWEQIEALDGRVAESAATPMVSEAARLLNRGTRWFLRWQDALRRPGDLIARYRPTVAAIAALPDSALPTAERNSLAAAASRLAGMGAPPAMARRAAWLELLFSALDITETAADTGQPPDVVARLHFALAARLDLARLAGHITALPSDSHWQALARSTLREDLAQIVRVLVARVLESATPLDAWEQHHTDALARYRQLCADAARAGPPDAGMIGVLLRALRCLA